MRRQRRARRPARSRNDVGSTTVEFVIAAALMVMILLAVVQIGVYFHLRAVAQTAARHGLDEVRVAEGSPEAGIGATSAFLDQSGNGIEGRSITAGRSETEASVRVAGRVVTILPGLNLTIEVEVKAPVERVTP